VFPSTSFAEVRTFSSARGTSWPTVEKQAADARPKADEVDEKKSGSPEKHRPFHRREAETWI
jgi:hypothetical protein